LKRCLVVGPNGGASFGKGGGSYVALRIAQTLASTPNTTVGLLALLGCDPDSLARSFHLSLPVGRVKSFFSFRTEEGQEPSLNQLTTPYVGAIAVQLTHLLQRTIRRFDPDLLVFNDDSPRLVRHLPVEKKTLLYAHFPYACRLRYNIADSDSSRSFPRLVSDAIVKPWMIRLFETDNTSVTWLASNSSITRRYMIPTFRREVSVIHPPTDPVERNYETRSNLVLSVGAIQPNKRFADVIRAMKSTSHGCKCLILGHIRDQSYFRELLRLIHSLGLDGTVQIIPDAPREVVLSFLRRSKVIVHASRFEPFGLSVVEGMAAGAVPIVYAGENSGPWHDIVQEGEFGFGFHDSVQLASRITELVENRPKWSEYSSLAIKRSTMFSPNAFSSSLLKLVEVD